ncbi:hypothetical protein OCHUTO_0502 [Orientia chuto str. Dubai]|uniref:Uncharacterized protein n=1 Tax=Orientia chuto str. Dubai TaxID=1359168 RepID=A0A0F3MKQ4_9RICK|nr:hypothetical protein OCHUTO_0502 [Orientia chuto str. Dubai]
MLFSAKVVIFSSYHVICQSIVFNLDLDLLVIYSSEKKVLGPLEEIFLKFFGGKNF